MNNIIYCFTPEFERDFKKLEKRFKSLSKDFERMKKFSIEIHYLQGVKTNAFVPIEGFCSDKYQSMKVRQFACLNLKNRGNQSGIRVIFVYEPSANKITFIEIYFKGDKSNEDRTRLKRFLKALE